jgi:putative transposase
MLWEAAQVNRWWVHELNIQPDHVHMLVQLDATTTVARAAQIFKGGSSYLIRREFPELEEFIWGESFWADGYFAETIGVFQEDAIRRYIKEQRKHDQSMPPVRYRGL